MRWTVVDAVGSSPLARGALHRRRLPVGRGGIIPARAGSTEGKFRCPTGGGDHPRSRGEHPLWNADDLWSEGSSPLARGALDATTCVRSLQGIIPARAGSTPAEADRVDDDGDHPRSRGEHPATTLGIYTHLGSSPLARGARTTARGRHLRQGIIPARAGSTASTISSGMYPRDHPRSRGEHGEPITPGELKQGSSPLARGAPGHRG